MLKKIVTKQITLSPVMVIKATNEGLTRGYTVYKAIVVWINNLPQILVVLGKPHKYISKIG